MAKVDFITLANIIFKEKDKYKFVTDEEKENNFFVINRKFAFKYLRQAQFFNYKSINKASAIDVWFQICYKTTNGTPDWWWKSKQTKKSIKSEFTKNDIELVKNFHKLKDNDIDFLIKYNKDELKENIKKIKKFGNGTK